MTVLLPVRFERNREICHEHCVVCLDFSLKVEVCPERLACQSVDAPDSNGLKSEST